MTYLIKTSLNIILLWMDLPLCAATHPPISSEVKQFPLFIPYYALIGEEESEFLSLEIVAKFRF